MTPSAAKVEVAEVSACKCKEAMCDQSEAIKLVYKKLTNFF